MIQKSGPRPALQQPAQFLGRVAYTNQFGGRLLGQWEALCHGR